MHYFVFLVGVDVLGIEDEILFFSYSLPVHTQYTFGKAIAGFLFLPDIDGFLFLVEGLISFECFLSLNFEDLNAVTTGVTLW